MSILYVLLLTGVAYGRFIFPPHHNEEKFKPFVTPSQSRRICTELCMSGLGGKPCGDNCMDIMPQEMPIELIEDNAESNNQTRSDACPILCQNQLGYPLCDCDESTISLNPNFRVDFVQICSYYCLKHKYQLYGCQSCRVYEKEQARHSNVELYGFKKKSTFKNGIDWEEWCKQQCLVGNGGAACNCDILPFSIKI